MFVISTETNSQISYFDYLTELTLCFQRRKLSEKEKMLPKNANFIDCRLRFYFYVICMRYHNDSSIIDTSFYHDNKDVWWDHVWCIQKWLKSYALTLQLINIFRDELAISRVLVPLSLKTRQKFNIFLYLQCGTFWF